MTFYERYEALCRVRGIEPCSQSTAEKLGTTRSNISYWKKGTKPNVEIVRSAATMLQTSADYLLGRTDDDTDYTIAQKTGQSLPENVTIMLSGLDSTDLEKVMIYARGLLDGDKYQNRRPR